MSAQVVVFDILAIIAVIAALGVVLARNPVHSAVSLVLTFVNVAGIYVILRAEFLAAVQIIVYTGAILVLVLFVIMLVHQEDLPEFHGGQPVQRMLGFILGLVLLGEVAAAILTRTALGQTGPWTPAQVASVGGNVQAIGQVLYSGYVLPIQATALVLLVATIGALVLARPDVAKVPAGMARQVLTISLAHPRGDTEEEEYEIPALPDGTSIKPEAGDRELVMAKSGDEFVEHPAWGEHRSK
jgi:NADH-quinone oxidoreductase subunit J